MLSVNSRLTSTKRMEETKKLLKAPLNIARLQSSSLSSPTPIVPFTPKDSSHSGHVVSAPATPKRVNELKSTLGSSKSPNSMSLPGRLATNGRNNSLSGSGSVKMPKIKLKFGSSGSNLGASSHARGTMSSKGERKIVLSKKTNKARGFIMPSGGGVGPRP